MRDAPEHPDVGDELWVAVPPGWIELVAHENDEDAARWFDRLLAKTPNTFDENGMESLRTSYDEVRRQMPRDSIDAAGVLVTTLDNDEVTLWQFTMSVVAGPPSGDVNVMAVVERFMGSAEGRELIAGKDDFAESFQTQDGRDGVAIHTTTRIDDDGRLAMNIPHADSERLGVVYAAIRLNRAKSTTADRIAIIVGVAPNVEQRLPMSIVAAQLTLSARLRDSDAPPLPGRIDIDVTGYRRDQVATDPLIPGQLAEQSPHPDSGAPQ